MVLHNAAQTLLDEVAWLLTESAEMRENQAI
jgi:hypothetical protein